MIPAAGGFKAPLTSNEGSLKLSLGGYLESALMKTIGAGLVGVAEGEWWVGRKVWAALTCIESMGYIYRSPT